MCARPGSGGGPPVAAVAAVVAVIQVTGSAGAARWQQHETLSPVAVALLLVGPAAITMVRDMFPKMQGS